MVIMVMTLGSCNDYLTRAPQDNIADETFWKNSEQLRMAADAIYGRVYNVETVQFDVLSDNTLWYVNTYWRLVGSGLHATDYSLIRRMWVRLYEAIRECNAVLEHYEEAEETVPGTNERIAAEARVLRAYFYSYLTSLYGDVPLVTRQLNVDETYGSRTPREEVVDFILDDLDEAIAVLPPEIPTGDALGRVNKGAALALKARIALYNERYSVAEQAAKQVMDLGVYELYNNGNPEDTYRDLFDHSGKLANGQNKETIWARINLTGISEHNLSREIQVPSVFSRWNATKSLADSYLMEDGLPIDQSPLYSEDSYEDVFEDRDPRMTQTLLQPGSEWGGSVDGNPDNDNPDIYTAPLFRSNGQGCITITGYYFTKYVELPEVGIFNHDENDIHLIRYAEVLLTYAEAKMEQGTLTQEDLDISINLLRDRVGMKHMNLSELAANGLDLRTEIRRERRVELALEGQRYFDILRWEEGERLGRDMKGVKKEWVPVPEDVADLPADEEGYIIAAGNRVFEGPKHYLWPVPADQLQLNPELGQNPGW